MSDFQMHFVSSVISLIVLLPLPLFWLRSLLSSRRQGGYTLVERLT